MRELDSCIARLATALGAQLTRERIQIYQEALEPLQSGPAWELATKDLLVSVTRFPTIPEMRVAYYAARNRLPALEAAQPEPDWDLNQRMMKELRERMGDIGREMG